MEQEESENMASLMNDSTQPTPAAASISIPTSEYPASAAGTPTSGTTSSDRKKRKRVTRACDECRKKKVKCDGQMPCIHCTVYSYDCTYDQPSSRKKVPESLKNEHKLKNAEIILEAIFPGLDVNSSNIDLHYLVDQIKQGVSPQVIATQLRNNSSKRHKSNNNTSGSNVSTPEVSRGLTLSHTAGGDGSLLSPSSADEISTEFKIILPPKNIAIQLIEAVWENACVLFRFYHRPSFIRDLDLLYEADPDDYTDKQYKILPLVYSVMAVGVLFSMDKSEQLGIKDASEGYKYFAAARKMLDITDCRDLYSIQSVVMMVLFLQCSARLSTCYSYIGIALRSALRAGLHRQVSYNFNPIELETRKRLFWAIRKMDIYVNAVLGLPRSVDDEDFDQELPVEIDDENITEDGYYPQREGKLSSAGISNSHTTLMTVLGHIMSKMYPVKPNNTNNATFSTFSRVEELEGELAAWYEEVPEYMKPGADVPMNYFKANRLLSMTYCYVQIMLYRPFVHFCSPSLSKGLDNSRTKILGQKCINVARQAVYYATDLISQNMLNGAYWFSVYTLFFSVATLVYYCHVNAYAEPEKTVELKRVAEMGKDALIQLKDSSVTAARTYDLLNGMFEQLNRKTSEQGTTPAFYAVGNVTNVDNPPTGGDGVVQQLKSATEKNDNNIAGKEEDIFNVEFPEAEQSTTSNNNSDDAENSYLYAPGLMDQVDQQLFGRFLPPYMMQQGSSQNSSSYSSPSLPPQPNQQQPPPQPQQQQQQNFLNYQDFFNAQPLGPVQNQSKPPQPVPPQKNGTQIKFQQPTRQQQQSQTNTPTQPQPQTNATTNITNTNTNTNNNNNNNNNENAQQDANGMMLSWDDFLTQNMELSGLSSLMPQE